MQLITLKSNPIELLREKKKLFIHLFFFSHFNRATKYPNQSGIEHREQQHNNSFFWNSYSLCNGHHVATELRVWYCNAKLAFVRLLLYRSKSIQFLYFDDLDKFIHWCLHWKWNRKRSNKGIIQRYGRIAIRPCSSKLKNCRSNKQKTCEAFWKNGN